MRSGVDPDPLIPLDKLIQLPAVAAPHLSPDGARIAALLPRDGVPNLWIAPVEDFSAARPVTRDTGRGIQARQISGAEAFFWSRSGTHLIYAQDHEGDENWLLYGVDLESGDTRALTPFENTQVRVVASSWDHPDTLLIAMNHRDPRWHVLHLLDVTTGDLRLVEENDRFYGYFADRDLKPRLAIALGPDARLEIHGSSGDGHWEHLRTLEDGEGVNPPIGFDPANRVVYTYESEGRDTRALVAWDLESGETTVLAEDARVDIGDVLAHPTTGEIQAYSTNYTRVEWHALDASVRSDLDYLASLRDGDVNIDSRSRDDRRWLVRYTLDDAPETTYLYQRDAREARKIFVATPDLEGLRLSKLHPAVIRSRDGWDLVSYLALPPWTDPDATGRPREPVPTVVIVHGGPSDERAQYGFFPLAHWIANRGYGVLLVNFRGSPGFGKAFLDAQRLEWGGKMHEDVLDQAAWAVDEGSAREDRLAVLGGSYWGYETLVAMTFTPDVFACGISVVGPSNLETFAETIPPHWSLDHLARRIGDPRTEEGRSHLHARSPYHFVHQVTRPMLIAQGANDSRVPQRESDQIVAAMRERGVEVTYLLYPSTPSSRRSWPAASAGATSRSPTSSRARVSACPSEPSTSPDSRRRFGPAGGGRRRLPGDGGRR